MTVWSEPAEDTVAISVSGLSEPLRFVRHAQVGGFWELFARGDWEPETLAAIVENVRPGSRFFDIGAWIGPMSLAAAQQGASVVALEPDPTARARLIRNIELNGAANERIVVLPVALARRDGRATLSSGKLGDSTSSLVRPAASASVSVQTIGARRWSVDQRFSPTDVVKIDVEGAEFQIVPRMRRALAEHRPLLLLSVHGYHWNDRLRRVPPRLRRPVGRVVNACARTRLLLSTRHYSSRRRWAGPELGWVVVDRRSAVRLVMSMAGAELMLSHHRPTPTR